MRSIRTALVVGTLLALINHGQALLTGHFTYDRLISMLVTYLVPFSVSMYSQIQGKRQRDTAQYPASITPRDPTV
ncbi:MAG: nitrate/nitrite transporter NrtS [Chloroflexota bacterium]|nr:nitrate/nitrite transporter NrtS [Chloroflexota bacterium]